MIMLLIYSRGRYCARKKKRGMRAARSRGGAAVFMKELMRISRVVATALALWAPLAIAVRVLAGADDMADLVVVSTPLPLTADKTAQTARHLSTNELRIAGAANVADALELLSSVTVSERGDSAVQADLSLRGSSFQQVLVTLDGAPLYDPQTAHHNMDLPLPPGALDGITVLPGPGSALFGPIALGGVVDLSTRKPAPGSGYFSLAGGDFGTVRSELACDAGTANAAVSVSAWGADSDGFMEGADYSLWGFWISSLADADGLRLRLSAGHVDKDFGAQDFYAAYPSRERTATTVIDAAPEIRIGEWSLKALARFRGHDDTFVLIEDDPDFYRNDHTSESLLGRVVLSSPSTRFGTAAIGVESVNSSLESSNMGNRDSATTSLFIHHRMEPNTRWTVEAGLRSDDHTRWGAVLSPSAGVSWRPDAPLAFRASVARGFRPPGFTELYYTDPRNIGNPDLDPENAWGGEAAVDINPLSRLRASLAVFGRQQTDLIDWVRAAPADPWEARNIGESSVTGAELGIEGDAGPLRLRADYRRTEIDAEDYGLESKYALNAPRDDIGASAVYTHTAGFEAGISARWREAPDADGYCLVSARAAQRIGRFTVFAGGRNLLNEQYEEIPGVPTPGRYLEAGVETRW